MDEFRSSALDDVHPSAVSEPAMTVGCSAADVLKEIAMCQVVPHHPPVALPPKSTSPRTRHRGIWTCRVLTLGAVLLSLPAQSAPRIFEETARVVIPDASFTSFSGAAHIRVAVSGNYLVITAAKEEGPSEAAQLVQAAFLFERQPTGAWSYVTRLVEQRDNFADAAFRWMDVSIEGGLMAVAAGPLRIFELTPQGWRAAAADSTLQFDSSDVEISGRTILVSDGTCSWNASIIRENSQGIWSTAGEVQGAYRTCDGSNMGGDVDISGDAVIVANEEVDPPNGPDARIYQAEGTTWRQAARVAEHEAHQSVRPVAIDESTALVGGTRVAGLRVYDRSDTGEWLHTTNIAPAEILMTGNEARVEAEGGYVAVAWPENPYRGGSAGVFRRDESRKFEHLGTLVLSRFGGIYDVSMDVGPERITIAAGGLNAAYVYEIEQFSQPQLVLDDFEDGSSADWSPLSGRWTVVSARGSRVYDYAGTGDARTVLNGLDWQNQAIQADMRALSFDGSNRFVGLMARYVDDNNHYYVALRNSNRLELRKRVNGVLSLLSYGRLPVTANRDYRVRLEAIGSLLRVYVDGAMWAQVIDADLPRGGVGLRAYFARAQFDNVVVTPNPVTVLAQADFEGASAEGWTFQSSDDWVMSIGADNRIALQQSAPVGDRRALAGSPYLSTGNTMPDQVVEARARALSFDTAGNPWFGLIARYKDDRNYVYLTVNRNGFVSLRKLTDGVIHVIATANNIPVSAGTWYRLRLLALGPRLEAYLDDRRILEGVDLTQVVRGETRTQFGLMTYRTAAEFDDVSVIQP